jgi:hypothetical protein
MAAALQHAPKTAAPPAGGQFQRASRPERGPDAANPAAPPAFPAFRLSEPGDAAEREADAMAAAVMRGERAGPATAGGAGVSRKCAACAEEEVKRKADGAAPAGPAAVAVAALAGPGRPLDAAIRGFMEPRFGRSFADVRVHDGPAAQAAAGAIAAHAFQAGNRIGFAAGRYRPDTPEGMHLIAHELAHVAQGGMGVRRKACGHDGRATQCGGHYWVLADEVTGGVIKAGVDRLIMDRGLARQFPGTWVGQVWTPPNPAKKTGATDRGGADAVRISTAGKLSLEIVEVKSRADNPDCGCARATTEAKGYVKVLTEIAGQVATISQALRPDGLRIPGNRKPNVGQALILRNAGIDLSDPLTSKAWSFYNNLQNKLETTFTAGFTGMEAKVFDGGTPGTTYRAGPPVFEQCRTSRKKPGLRTLQLGYQLNGEGGLSYGCERGPCRDKEEQQEEERKRQEEEQRRQVTAPGIPGDQPVDQEQPLAQPQTEPLADPAADPEADPYTVPILVGTGASAAALSAAAIKQARDKARRLAEERLAKEALERAERAAAERAAKRAAANNVIDLAERRALREAAKRGGTTALKGASVAGKVAGKAVIYAEVAAAVFLLVSGRAEAKPGFGPSPLEAFYDSMTKNGHPPSDEMKALIESDPELRKLAEAAGQTGDVTPLQEAATKKMMELVRDNPGEFTAEELEILKQAQGATSGGSIETKEQLAAAIAAAEKQLADKGVAVPEPPSGTGTGGTGGAGGKGSSSGSGEGDLAGNVDDIGKRFPKLSPAMKGALAAAPKPVRDLFDGITGKGKGPKVDDGVVGEFLASVPTDLTAEEKDKLLAAAKPAEGANAAAIMDSIRKAVEAVRAEPAEPSAEGGDGAEARDEEAGGQAPAEPAAAEGSGATGEAEGETEAERDQVTKALMAAIEGYEGWDGIGVGQGMWVGRFAGAAVGTVVDCYFYTKVATTSGGSVRVAAFVQARVTQQAKKAGDVWKAVVVASTPYASETGVTVPGEPAGRKLQGVMQ